jgi:hypothetical protein
MRRGESALPMVAQRRTWSEIFSDGSLPATKPLPPSSASPCHLVVVATGGPSWRLKGAMAPPTQLKFTQYYLVFISFNHVKYKIFQISPLNFYVMTFGPSYNDGQGPPLVVAASDLRIRPIQAKNMRN